MNATRRSTRTRPRRHGRVLVAAAALVFAACGDDDSSGDTLAPLSPAPVTTAVSTTRPATTTPPTTAAPTSTTSTTTTVAPSTTTTTTIPKAARLVMSDVGLGSAIFGADADETIAYISSILGAPTADSGWADPFSSFGVCPGTEVRGVTWGDLLLLFSDASVVDTGRRHFFSYQYGPPFGSTIEPAGMRLGAGPTVGSTVADLRAVFPEVIVNPGDGIFGPNFYVNDNLTGFLSGSQDTDQITSITGGIGCGE